MTYVYLYVRETKRYWVYECAEIDAKQISPSRSFYHPLVKDGTPPAKITVTVEVE